MKLLVLFLCVFLGNFLTFALGKRFYTNNVKKIVVRDLDIFSSASIYLWVLFGVIGASFIIPNLVPFYFFLTLLSLTFLVLYLSYRPMSQLVQNILEFCLCWAGACLLNNNGSFWIVLGTAFFWLLAWRVFRSFDRFPFISMLMSLVWMLSLLVVGQIIILPNFLMVVAGLLALLVFSVFRFKLKYSCTNLGHATSSLVGYSCAGIWSYFFLKGNISSSISAYAYYLFEIMLMTFGALKGQQQIPLFVKSLQNKEAGAKTMKVLFWNLFLITMLAVFVSPFKKNTASFLFILSVIILYHTYIQLSNISNPLPGYKEIFKDLKQGLKSIYVKKQVAPQVVRVEKKTKAPQKKKSVQTTKKKVVKGKKKK